MSAVPAPSFSRAAGIATTGRRVGRGLRRLDYGPPVVAFLVSSIILYAAARTEGSQFFSAISWSKWDSGLYEQIAAHGYSVARCTPAQYSTLGPGWCGDSAWFPGYPGMLAIFYSLGLPQVGLAVAVSWVFDLALLILIWNAFLRSAAPLPGYLGLLFVACCPGGIYTRTAFPMSVTAFFIVLWLLGLSKRRWGWAAVAGACAALCYPTGFVLAPLTGVWILLDDPRPLPTRLRMAVMGGVISGLGTVAALGFIGLDAGRLNAFFLNQSRYKHGLHEPFAELWPLIHGAFTNVSGAPGAEDLEAALAAFVVVVLLVGVSVLAIRGQATRWDWFLILYLILFWLVPGTQGGESWWRNDTLLLPAALLMPRVRNELTVLVCGASLAVFPLLAYFFFAGLVI